MKKRTFIALASVLVAVVAFSFSSPGEKYFDIAKSLDIFSTLFKEVNTHYVDEIDPKKLIDTGIQGMLEPLDPYTIYIPEEDQEAFSIITTGQYAGIGALIGVINGKTVVTHPYRDFPAQRAGLRVGDEFLTVDGKDVKGKATSDVSALLKGKPKTDVEIVIQRGDKPITFRLQRERIKISNVVYQGMLNGQTGYVKLDDFTPGAAREVEEALSRLKKEGAKSLIIDLRDNPGGLLYEAVNIVNLFIPKGKEVVSTKGKVQEWNKSYTTLNSPVDLEIPLAILTSGGSASASEIVAGALQDYDRAILVGEKTFGKGLVQTTRPLAYNAQLKVTTARYYIPSGRCIQALDYANRKSDGSVSRFADSLKAEFKTAHGRLVYDGGGLDPDIKIVNENLPAAVVELVQQGWLFEYATIFTNQHPKPASLRAFHLSEADYQQFAEWMKQQKFSFQSELETKTNDLIASAKAERYYEPLRSQLEDLRERVLQSRKVDWMRHKKEISGLLESQIGFHYEQVMGQAEISLDRDAEIKEAVRSINDPAAYRKLLEPAQP